MSAQIVFHDGVSPTLGSIERANAFLGVAFTASNFDNTGILGWEWTILYKPPGSATGLTSSTAAAPQFTPDVEGTYLLRLQVFSDAARTQLVDSDEQFVSVAFAAPYAWHIPAVGETGQRGAAGWGNPVETIIRALRAAIVSMVSGITQLTGDATAGPGSGSQTTTVVQARGLRETGGPTTLTMGAVADGEYLRRSGSTVIGGPGGGGGVADLQDAYDGGTDVLQSVSGGILLEQGSGSPGNTYVLRIEANVGAGSPVHGLQIERAPTPSGDSGTGASILMGANATGEGLSVQHLGSGTGVLIATAGAGEGLRVNTSSGTGDGITALVASGKNPIQSQINGVNALTIDGAGARVDIGAAAGVLEINGYGNVVLGSGTGATLKSYRAYTTDAGTGLGTTNGRMTLVARAGVNTAASTVAEIAVGAGSAGETLLTKGGRLYAHTTIREILIENGVTLAAGDVVRPQSASHVGKASADVNGIPALGIVLVGGVGDGTTVYALVAMSGYVSGLSGLTTGATVYLGTTAGQYTTTMPTDAGARVVALGQAISTTEMILNVDIPRPPALTALAVNAEQTGTTELSVGMIYLSAGSVIAADSRAMLGATSGGGDTADLRLRRFTGGAQVAIFSATGAPASTTITAPYTVAASDWYELTLAAGGAAQVARCQGVHLRVYGETN